MPTRQNVMFPDVAIVHKGTPKQIIEKDGKKTEIQGKDLNNKFRIHFLPGTENVRQDWHAKHAGEFKEYGPKFTIPSGYEVEKMRAIIPAPTVWEAWDYGSEAYSAGRRIALADDDHYLILRDPVTGEYKIKDGKPYQKFEPGETIKYSRGGKFYELPMKSHGRLRLVLEDLVNAGHLVQVILKTTSFYDCQNIQRELAGIQMIADSVNGGNAGGIPLLIYRSEQEIVWNKPDGSASRIKKWFINIAADPNWVKYAFAQLGRRAIAAPAINSLMSPPPVVAGQVNPDEETFESGDEESDFGDKEENVIGSKFAEPAIRVTEITNPVIVAEEVQENPKTPPEEDEFTFPLMSERVVTAVAKRAGINKSDAAIWLSKFQKEGKLPERISMALALDFASHLNV